ncbi:hypothetical protein PC129_g7731 [Phytophthora cactorum]|uniref:Uncharacterized protein n=1 Tax=Phytophthora cactorum TaxID=29920 RepID=A0A8T1KSE9_9STRA|nr:hypothetical protein Pcac1_g12993 [Phytophthora cactorum]KAG2899578.1 hypothetical protein PC115_g16488 [Phytophthora cactorum]KAG2907885.1 hypothetical protein PC114_g10685 [Phytophthora cactorum]KAG2940429.1 hypothetical protein PC117_g10515 [Phytophthora cactorum]KAG2995224.1 hypothetical protein PC119_g18109 [Phytophthora cactorum]
MTVVSGNVARNPAAPKIPTTRQSAPGAAARSGKHGRGCSKKNKVKNKRN